MLYAQLFKRLLGGLRAPGLHVVITLPDAVNGFLEVLPLPFQIFSQGVIEHGGGVLAVTLRVLLQLGLAFRFDGYYIHDAFSVGVAEASVNWPYPMSHRPSVWESSAAPGAVFHRP